MTPWIKKFTRAPRIAGAAMLPICLLILTGCLSRPALKTETFSFNPPAQVESSAVTGPALAIKRITVAAPFAFRSLVYRTGEFTYQRDPYAELLDFPEKELLAPIRTELANEGDFRSVELAGSALNPDIIIEIYVSRLFGDFREPSKAKAISRAQFTFYQTTNGIASGVIFQREYSREIPLRKPTAASLVAGWNQEVEEIIGDALADYRQGKR